MLKILIIDDEEHVRSLIRNIIDHYATGAVVVGEAGSVASGLKSIRKHQPDVVLLDIMMADGTGFDLLNQLGEIRFKLIFITAYEEFAIRAFKYSAVDYILKPVDADNLLESIRRAQDILQQEMVARINTLQDNIKPDSPHQKIILKTIDNIHIIRIDELIYCESDHVYTRFHLADGRKILVSKLLKEYEEMLSAHGFMRVHRSYLINMSYVVCFEKMEGGYVVLKNDDRIPVASRKREQLINWIENMV